MTKTFSEFDHSGDIGIEARGADLAELLESATLGLFTLLCRGRVKTTVERPLRVSSSAAGDLVVDWLCEVIAVGATHGEVYGAVEITSAGEFFADGILRGEPVDPERHDLRFDVKAATYHDLSIEQSSDGLQARIVFDL